MNKDSGERDYSIDDLADMLTTQILQEQFLSKESIRPKVVAFIRAFVNLKNIPKDYNGYVSKSQNAKRLRALEKERAEHHYWRQLVRVLDPDNIDKHYQQCAKMLIAKGFKEDDNQ